MSHIVTVNTQVRDPVALAASCRRLGLPEPVPGTARMYANQTAEGMLVQLSGWKYPVAIDLATGEIRQDSFGGRWGNPQELDRLVQAYAVEMTRLVARRQGYLVREQPLPDGAIKLFVEEAAG